MLKFLFRRLTTEQDDSVALFSAVTAKARLRHWYVEGQIPDTLDGRFAVLATILALVIVRLEALDNGGNALSVGLTERFVEVMEAEHRELGLGDPTLGKTVRKLVGSLGRRVELWRSAVGKAASWSEATAESLYRDEADPDALSYSANALERLWGQVRETPLRSLAEGRLT